jgi:hypothetical protein
MGAQLFKKLLLAKYSPKNGCYAEDGTILTVERRESVPVKDCVPHHFVSIDNPRLQSRYGWVKGVPTLFAG